ncbi:MAG: hypothetical protein ACKVT0_24025 [Planctomycetaceae bacterium]
MHRFSIRSPLAELGLSRKHASQAIFLMSCLIAGTIVWRRLAGGFTPPATAYGCLSTVLMTALGACAWWLNRDATQRTLSEDSTATRAIGENLLPVDMRWLVLCLLAPAYLLGWSLMPAASIAGITFMTAWMVVSLTAIYWADEAISLQAEFAASHDADETTHHVHATQSVLPFAQPRAENALTTERECLGENRPAVECSNAVPEKSTEIEGQVVALEELIDESIEDSLADEATADRPDVTLWMTRRTDADGFDSLEGGTKVRFIAGQKLAVVHLGFFPSFAQTPEMECEILDEGSFHIRPAAVYPYGARLEIQRSGQPGESDVIELGFLVRSPLSVLSPAA